MPDERRSRIRLLLGTSADGQGETARLCDVCAEVTGMSGAGILLMSGELSRGSVCATDPVSTLIEQLQDELGEGPCVDASRLGRPVLEPDLSHPQPARWLAFREQVLGAGVRAVFGFPLRVGAARLGALNLYRNRPGPLTDDQHAYALAVADVAAEAVLLLQAGVVDGALAAGLELGANFQVNQAAGMVAVQADVSVTQALVRLRGYAFGHGRFLKDVARDVVERSLRFDRADGAAEPDS